MGESSHNKITGKIKSTFNIIFLFLKSERIILNSLEHRLVEKGTVEADSWLI